MFEDIARLLAWVLGIVFPFAFTYCASKSKANQDSKVDVNENLEYTWVESGAPVDDQPAGSVINASARGSARGSTDGSKMTNLKIAALKQCKQSLTGLDRKASTNLDKPEGATTQVKKDSVDPFDPNYQTLKCAGADLGRTEKGPMQAPTTKKEQMKDPFDPNYQTLKCDGADLGRTEKAPIDKLAKTAMKSPFDPNYATMNIKGADLGKTEMGPRETGPKKIVAKSPFDPNYATLNIKGADLGRTERAPQEPKGSKKPKAVSPFDPRYATLNIKGADLGATEAAPAPGKAGKTAKIGKTGKRVTF